MEVPSDLKFLKSHEWVRVEGPGAIVGISDFAQKELNDIVFVDLPEVGREVKAGQAVCVIESTKAASDVYAPLSGKVSAVNEALNDSPDLVNSSPYHEGWLFEIEMKDPSELDRLLDCDRYRETIQD
jgi:glycine cleavage system H protein